MISWKEIEGDASFDLCCKLAGLIRALNSGAGAPAATTVKRGQDESIIGNIYVARGVRPWMAVSFEIASFKSVVAS